MKMAQRPPFLSLARTCCFRLLHSFFHTYTENQPHRHLAATPARPAIFAVGALRPTLAISCTAARRIAVRFSGLLTRAIHG
jgi:hypothetical protein